MKTILHTLIAFLIALMNTESFSAERYSSEKANNLVPVSARNWNDSVIEVPENLKYVKAKYALVPVPEIVWGNAGEAVPSELLKSAVPVASKVWDDQSIELPEGLDNIKARFALVPVPAKEIHDYPMDETVPAIEESR